jgi:hypothetical protein
MTRTHAIALPALAILAAACAASNPPDTLKPSADQDLAMVWMARGVQIYECRQKDGAYEWAFVAPEADLLDGKERRIGKHYAGPTWQAYDGSRVTGTVKERANAPDSDAIPWLLLTAKSEGGEGSLSKVTSIQRLNTYGGVAPKGGCTQAQAGKKERVDYRADYYFFVPK